MTRDALDVAVAIVTYKSAALTVACLNSLCAEIKTCGLNVHVFVVDNDSGDLPVIRAACEAHDWSGWVTLILSPRNGGFAYGNNRALACAYARYQSRFFFLLNPDTEVRRDALSTMVKFLEDNPHVGIAGCGIENPDGSNWPIAFRFPSSLSELSSGVEVGVLSSVLKGWEVARTMSNAPEPVDWICGAAMMIRPAVFETIGTLDENYFLYFEETDFCFRAKRAGFETWYVPQSRVMHVVGQSTKVTERNVLPRRLPTYWFESRRRFFIVSYGISTAILIDLVSITAHLIGTIKRALLGRLRTATPHLTRDLIENSPVWPRNRKVPSLCAFFPAK